LRAIACSPTPNSTVEMMLNSARDMRAKGWEFTFHASYVEIYNESIRDLLRATSDPTSVALSIRDLGRDSTVEIPGLVSDAVACQEDVETIMVKASRSKAVCATAMNAQSSRSHCVFTLNIVGE
jgi:kinesin family protein C1